MAALAGCSQFDAVGEEGRQFDTDRLAELGAQEVSTPPDAFPVSVPDAMVDRHRDRARQLVERVPEEPDVPNGAVVQQLRRDREAVLEDIEDRDGADEDPADEPLERLDEARHIREEAAAVEAAYRTATGDLTRESVGDRRERLRRDLLAFEADWTYRGDDPAAAVVFHRELEELRRDVRRGTEPECALPDDPATDVFGAGEIVSSIEDGRAALADADRLRGTYREGLSDPRPYRSAISAAAGRLDRLGRASHRELHGYIDAEEPPFDRSIEGTAVERLYREAAGSVRHARSNTEEARHRGDPADAFVRTGFTLAALRTLDAVVTAIEDGQVEEPADADAVAAARQEAVDALETAWSANPTVVAVELARPAYYLLRRGTRDLGGRGINDDDPHANDADRAFVNFVRAARHAEVVPRTVDDLHRTLEDVAE